MKGNCLYVRMGIYVKKRGNKVFVIVNRLRFSHAYFVTFSFDCLLVWLMANRRQGRGDCKQFLFFFSLLTITFFRCVWTSNLDYRRLFHQARRYGIWGLGGGGELIFTFHLFEKEIFEFVKYLKYPVSSI